MSDPADFLASPFFPETLALLRRGLSTLPIEGDTAFLTQLAGHADARIAALPADVSGLRAQFAAFSGPKEVVQLDLALAETEAYVDLECGAFSGTAFLFDPAEASRATFPELKQARAWANDGVPACMWSGRSMPSSFVMHAVQLVTAARAAEAVVATMTEYATWRFRITNREAAEFVCDWEGIGAKS
jgi:hypothetical protein